MVLLIFVMGGFIMYGKLVNGAIKYAPVNYLTEDNKMIFNFNTNVDVMKEYGFKEVINVVPSYDANTQTLTMDGYIEDADTITVKYVITAKPLSKEEQIQIQKNLALTFFAETLTDAQALQVPMLFEEFNGNGVKYKAGKRIIYEGVLYKVLQDHTSQEVWTPTAAHSLFAKVINETITGEIPDWEQPDSTNAYMKGNKVKFNGKIYESVIDNNVWSPTAYPSGWKEVTE